MRGLRIQVVLFASAALLVQGCSSSGTPETFTRIMASGSVHCSHVSGSVVFSPPLTASGHEPERISITAHLGRCTTAGSNVTVVSSGLATSTLTDGTSACSGLLEFPSSPGSVATPSTSMPITVDLTWAPGTIKPSVMRFSGFAASVDASGDVGFAFPGVGHSATVVGSFTGRDGGAVSTASAYTEESASQVLGGCSQLQGVASIPISSGELTLG